MLSYEQRTDVFASSHSSIGAGSVNKSVRGKKTPQHRHIWIVTGPAGCGKTTVAKHLAKQFSMPYIEGDEYHPQSNIDKMAQGEPLNDADRWDWLIVLRQQAMSALSSGAAGARGVVLTCSALKRKYRDVIRIAHYDDSEVMVHFLYLRADEETLRARVKARQGHYMKDAMVHSQLSSLEEPTEGETDATTVDVTGSPDEVKQLALSAVMRIMARDGVAAP